MAILAVFIPIGLLAVLMALGRYEELMLPPLADEPEEPDAVALTGRVVGAGTGPPAERG